MSKHFKYMTEKDFEHLKAMIDSGLSSTTITEITGRAKSTQGYVRNTATFAEYKQRIQRMVQKSNDKKKANAPAVPVAPVVPSTETLLLEIKQLLTTIERNTRPEEVEATQRRLSIFNR